MSRAVLLFVVGCVMGCATFKPMIAATDDTTDYRAFRVAAYEGTRLARAQTYIAKHPQGAFIDEVKAAFEEEEPLFFAQSQSTREGVRRYLADLPSGPHASAAVALLGAFESSMKDAELLDIARKVRFEDSKLEAAAVQRRAVGELVLGAIGVFLDENVYETRRDDGPQALRTLMTGPRGATWGAVPAQREEDLFFSLPTRPTRESRLLSLEISAIERDGRVVEGRIEGDDMFVKWAEADQIVRLDPSLEEDRNEAHVHVIERLGGALERRFPVDSCRDLRRSSELVWRACEGWEVIVSAGTKSGAKDSIVIRGPGHGGATPAKRSAPR